MKLAGHQGGCFSIVVFFQYASPERKKSGICLNVKLYHDIFHKILSTLYTYRHKIVFNGLCFPLVSILRRVGVLLLFFQQNGIEALGKLNLKKEYIKKYFNGSCNVLNFTADLNRMKYN